MTEGLRQVLSKKEGTGPARHVLSPKASLPAAATRPCCSAPDWPRRNREWRGWGRDPRTRCSLAVARRRLIERAALRRPRQRDGRRVQPCHPRQARVAGTRGDRGVIRQREGVLIQSGAVVGLDAVDQRPARQSHAAHIGRHPRVADHAARRHRQPQRDPVARRPDTAQRGVGAGGAVGGVPRIPLTPTLSREGRGGRTRGGE